MGELTEYERLISIRIMQEDAESIYSLLQTERDSVFAMEIIPYYALFVNECQNYFGDSFLPEDVANDFKDIRNYIKAYDKGFGKSRKGIVLIDSNQDNDFKSQLRFKFLKKLNIHLNFGSFWTDDKQIVGNTQQLAGALSIKSMFNPKQKDVSLNQGYYIGQYVSIVRDSLMESFKPPIIRRTGETVEIKYYCDINTNKKNNIFSKTISKDLNLFYLHLLCNMNFVKHILRPLFPDGNIWTFRVEYIVSYYTLRALERLKNYCDKNKDIIVETKEIHDILKPGELLFTTKLRNCMMHYNLENAGVISLENIDKPFYGIIENCFDGKSYQEYLIELHELSDMIIDFLNNQFDFSDVKLERL